MSVTRDVRKAIAAALEPLGGIVAVSPGPGGYDDIEREFKVCITFPGGAERVASEDRLDELIDGLVHEALESDRTLGGVVDDLRVTKHSGYRSYGTPGSDKPPRLGAEWTVLCLT